MSTKFVIIYMLLAVFHFPSPMSGVEFELWYQHFHTNDGGRNLQGGRNILENWCYDEAYCNEQSSSSDWNHGSCQSGKKQSPIDLTQVSSLKVDFAVGCPIDFGLTPVDGYNVLTYSITNYGKTIMVRAATGDLEWSDAKFRWPEKNDGTYTLAQFHFHWGPDDATGSEHKIDGKSYPLEMHLVHFRSSGPESYNSVTDAVFSGKSDALAVIGILFEVDPTATDSVLEPLVKTFGAFEKVPNENDTADVTGLPVKLRPEIMKQAHAYHYEGSLTTPLCNEIVQWIIMKDPIKVKTADIQKFRNITKKLNTFRSAQLPNNRAIHLLEIFH